MTLVKRAGISCHREGRTLCTPQLDLHDFDKRGGPLGHRHWQGTPKCIRSVGYLQEVEDTARNQSIREVHQTKCSAYSRAFKRERRQAILEGVGKHLRELGHCDSFQQSQHALTTACRDLSLCSS